MSEALHLGVTPWRLPRGLDADTLCRQAELAEQWGYDSFFLPENHFSDAVPIPDPMLLLAAIAARTDRIRLGTSSWLLPIRHPLLAAEQVAALDQLCGGRLILGLGRGYQAGMLDAFGVTNSDKRERFGLTLAGMLAAWRDELPGDALVLQPKPLQQPHPPLWVAAFGPRAIAQVGRLGLPYLASPVESLAELAQNQRRHHRALADHGHPVPAATVVMRTVFIAEDASRCAAVRDKLAMVPAAPFRKDASPPVDDWCLVGSAAEVGEAIGRYREQLGMTHMIAVRPRVAGIAEGWNRESLQALAAMRGLV